MKCNMELKQSTDDLMWRCYNAALELAFYPDLIKVRSKPENIPDDLWDEIWGWVDGLYQKSFFDRMTGRSSNKNFHNFSFEKEEKYMRDFLNRVESYVPI